MVPHFFFYLFNVKAALVCLARIFCFLPLKSNRKIVTHKIWAFWINYNVCLCRSLVRIFCVLSMGWQYNEMNFILDCKFVWDCGAECSSTIFFWVKCVNWFENKRMRQPHFIYFHWRNESQKSRKLFARIIEIIDWAICSIIRWWSWSFFFLHIIFIVKQTIWCLAGWPKFAHVDLLVPRLCHRFNVKWESNPLE